MARSQVHLKEPNKRQRRKMCNFDDNYLNQFYTTLTIITSLTVSFTTLLLLICESVLFSG